MSSNEPNGCCCVVDGREEVSGGFVVACCDGAEELEFGEEVLNEMTSFVELLIGKRLTNAPANSVRSVMDSSYGRRVWSCSSSTWPTRDSASGCFVPQERNGAKRVLSHS